MPRQPIDDAYTSGPSLSDERLEARLEALDRRVRSLEERLRQLELSGSALSQPRLGP